MKYSGGLIKKEREEIFKLFTEKTKLKFSEIEKAIKIRSNMVSYHLEKMQEQGLLEKKGEHYSLTKNAEKYLPIIQQIVGKELSPIPIVVIALVHNDKILLIKRKKRPYQGYWSLIGGKMQAEETFQQTATRLVKEKTHLNGNFISINSVLHERVEGDDIIKHSFILFFVKMETSETNFWKTELGELRWFEPDKLENIIPSDLWLIKNRLNSKIGVKSAHMTENQGELSDFRILK